jgi:hypothetical protein
MVSHAVLDGAPIQQAYTCSKQGPDVVDICNCLGYSTWLMVDGEYTGLKTQLVLLD